MPTRSGPRPDPGAAVAGGREEGTGRKPQFPQPPQAGGTCSPAGRPGSRASGGRGGRRGAAPLQVWEKQPPAPWPAPSDLLGKMLGWASGLSGRHRSCSFPCFRNVQPAPGLRSCRAAAGWSVAGGVLEQNAGRGPPALGWRTVWSLKASAYGEVPRPRTGRRRCGVCLPRRAAWACTTLAPGQGVGTGGRWLPTRRCVLSPQCFSFKTNYPRSNTVTFYIEICMSASL